MASDNLFQTLKERGFIFQTSNETALKEHLSSPTVIYHGVDPSGDSFHLGHLLPLMLMHRLQEAGHKVIFLIGGATGRVGDPSGKSTSRNLLSTDVVTKNAQGLKAQAEKIGLVKFSGENAALMVDNYDWTKDFLFLDDFMMEVAKYFSVNDMVNMSTFSERLSGGKPLSLLEFCYPVLQAWDFMELNKRYNCMIQFGGQDQWTNILCGVELVRKAMAGKEVIALTHPLLTTADGVKMGKTEKGPVWLDPQRTSPYDFYQYLVKTPDDKVPSLLKLFTFLPLDQIEELTKDPIKAQKALAFEVTKIIHGEIEAKKAAEFESMPEISLPALGIALEEALVASGCLPSKSEVRRRCEGGAVSIDEEKISDPKTMILKACIVKYGKGASLRVL